MSSNLEHFRTGFVRAIGRNKAQKSKPHAQHVVQKVDISNVVAATTKTTTTKLSDEQYRTWITAKAIACIHKIKGAI
jgi:hypothetical protein